MGAWLALPLLGTAPVTGNASSKKKKPNRLTMKTMSWLERREKMTPEQLKREEKLAKADEILHRQCYYHGFCSLRDASMMLSRPGDFLVHSKKYPPSAKVIRYAHPPDYSGGLEQLEKSREENKCKKISELEADKLPCTHAGEDSVHHLLVVKAHTGRCIQLPIFTSGPAHSELLFFFDPFVYGCRNIPELIQHHLLWQWPIDLRTHQRLLRPVKIRPWQIPHRHLKFEKVLGAGSYGEVCLATWKIDGGQRSIKVAIKSAIEDPNAKEGQRGALQEMLQEASLLKTFKHENIVKIHGLACLQFPVYMVLEFVSGGALNIYLEHQKEKKERAQKSGDNSFIGTTQYDRLSYCLQAARGIEYIHYLGALHRDIAGRNCLIHVSKTPGEVNVIKISDLGLTRTTCYYEMRIKRDLPLRWTAPETLKTYKWNTKSDVYSFAVLMWEIYTDGDMPYEGKKGYVVARDVQRGIRPYRPDLAYDKILRLIDAAWDRSANNRPEMVHIVQMLDSYLKECPRDLPDPYVQPDDEYEGDEEEE